MEASQSRVEGEGGFQFSFFIFHFLQNRPPRTELELAVLFIITYPRRYYYYLGVKYRNQEVCRIWALSPYRLLQAMSYAGAHCSETRMTVVCILPRPKKH